MIVFLFFLLAAAIAVLVIWKVFTVQSVVVEGNELYSSAQIEQIILNDEYSWNSLYVVAKHQLLDTGDVPFVDTVEVTLTDPHTLHVTVYEKGILGCLYIESIGQNAYFDKDGFVVETSVEEIPGVPKVTGITCTEVVLYKKLALEQEQVLGELLSLSQILKKYDLLPQEIHYDGSLEPTLTYDGNRVVVGSEEYLTQKVERLASILPQLSGQSGTLHLETWTPDTTDIFYEQDT